MILADTDVLIEYLKGIQPTSDQVAAFLSAGALQTTAITCFELLSGADEGTRGDSIRTLAVLLDSLPLDRKCAEAAATIRRTLQKEGNSIGMGDSLIAGIAVRHGLPLFTRNRKHFERVAGLTLV